ncbi:MAG: alanine racemase [Peptostreptococcaceae bacterium]|nr:alanine racemase [Peptostreptococcaceae bacterium]
MNYLKLDTPALIIDREIMYENCYRMQEYANSYKVNCRPHTKTHKMSKIAIIQEKIGAKGIAVAKVSEAEVMASKGLKDIFIANEIVGSKKLNRIRTLSEHIKISFGLDSIDQAKMIEKVFENARNKAEVLIEIEVGENRSGVINESDYIDLLKYLKKCKNIILKGVFSHDGHSYKAKDIKECSYIHLISQKRTLKFAKIAKNIGFELETVSIGSTPSMMHKFPILEGITEIRPGTYIFMDASQANAYGSTARCAATILTTVISLPTKDRIITDVGAKGITAQSRNQGFCSTKGLGIIKGYKDIYIDDVFDEHGIIYNKKLRDELKVGDILEIIPNHICPVVNLHETVYLISNGEVLEEIKVDCRGKLK